MPRHRKRRVWKEPEALRHLRESLSEERANMEFANVYSRPPHSTEELEMFIEHMTLEMYNAGRDQWPERDANYHRAVELLREMKRELAKKPQAPPPAQV